MSLHHVEIYVSDLKQSKEFYGWLLSELGYQLYQEWNEGFSYIYQSTYLSFVQTEQDYLDAGYHRRRIGLNHLAFTVETREEVDRLAHLIQEKGVRILYGDRYPFAGGENYYALYFEDPDRIKLEIVAAE